MTGFAAAVLARSGVHTLYGTPIAGLPVVDAPPGIAGVLARAHQVVRNAAAGAVGPDWIEVTGQGTGEPVDIAIDDRTEIEGLIAVIRQGIRGGGMRIHLRVDPGAGWDEPAAIAPTDPWADDLTGIAEAISATEQLVILAGPGVIRCGDVPGLHALAGKLGAGVLNTWGAKGIFHWKSVHHWATIGLQAADFRLAGVDDAQLIIATGVDAREAPDDEWMHRSHIVVEPAALAPLAEQVGARSASAHMPPLRTRLAGVTQAGWQSSAMPIPPTLATLHYGRSLAPGGFVAADAGVAGFWVARTFATTELGAVAVPPFTDSGWAAACVAVARLADPLRPALAVVDGSLDGVTEEIIEWARSRGIDVGVEIWAPDGEALSPEAHESRLARLADPVTAEPPGSLSTAPDQMAAFVEAAGPIRSWSPPAPSV